MANQIRFGAFLDDHVSSALDKVRDKFNMIGGKGTSASLFGNVGAMAASKALGLVGSAAGMAADFIGDSINASRDLSESLSKSNVVFGTSAKDIEAWGSGAATSIGLSKQAAIEAAASFGNLFVGLNMTKPAAAEMSKGVVQLAGDLASFNNMDPNEVLDKLRSGLSGEAEPLRRVGVFMTEAKVKAKGMEMGLLDAHGELSEGSKVLARYQIILDETGTAQGDFARTSDGLANTQRTANAELINSQAELGAAFESTALQVTKWQIDFLKGIKVVGNAVAEGRKHDPIGDFLWGSDADNALKEAKKGFTSYEDSVRLAQVGIAASNAKIRTSSILTAADYESSAQRVEAASEKTRAATVADANDIIAKVFDPLIAHAQLLVDKDEVAAAKRIAAATKAGSAERHQANLTLLNAQQKLDQTRATLLASGTLTAKEQGEWLRDLEKRYKSATGDAKEKIGSLIAKIKQLQGTQGQGIKITISGNLGWDSGGPRAKGGPVDPSKVYKVGEEGPEWFVPDTAGTIYPNGTPPGGRMSLSSSSGGGWSGGGGAPVSIPIYIDGRLVATVVDEHLFYRNQTRPR